MAEMFEGTFVLEEGTDEIPILMVDRYGFRFVWGFYDDELEISSTSSPVYLSGTALENLKELTADVRECQCERWIKGDGDCPLCGY